MAGSFDDRGAIDPSKGIVVGCFGKKRSGKSVMGLLLFDAYPYDKVSIDLAKDDGPGYIEADSPGVIQLRGTVDTLPRNLDRLRREPGEPMTIRYAPDASSPTYLADIDHVIGATYAHGERTGHACLLIHEVGRVARSNRTPPHMLAALSHNRHAHLTMIMCGPRTKTIDPLVLAQCDIVYAFDLPNPDDRKRLADEIGYDGDLDGAIKDLPEHGYLLYDAQIEKPAAPDDEDLRVVECPPLPREVVARVERYKRYGPPYREPAL